MNSPSAKGRACIKVDLLEAFDSVRWDFLEEVMRESTFGQEMVMSPNNKLSNGPRFVFQKRRVDSGSNALKIGMRQQWEYGFGNLPHTTLLFGHNGWGKNISRKIAFGHLHLVLAPLLFGNPSSRLEIGFNHP
ncbi:hypothetical protein QJS10_CPA08g01537 [Acorus calamus]|uniref:Reverse transcriptase domain-containing protein n=1 Tax=Acorus calamus TaxID=4465 RepID=A0AAV9EDA3_ACOCL|nr:hypothetical protein QJS10_CPA08g01537 [Acorus calamus]